MTREHVFEVRFTPRQSWVDETYLGNMLIEVLGAMARNTTAFDFQVTAVKGEAEKKEPGKE